jgi:hypothetical protein
MKPTKGHWIAVKPEGAPYWGIDAPESSEFTVAGTSSGFSEADAKLEYDAVQEGVELGYLCSRDGTPCDFQDYPYEYGADADGNRVERRCSKCGEYPHDD